MKKMEYRLEEDKLIFYTVLGYGNAADGETAEIELPLTSAEILDVFYAKILDITELPPKHAEGSPRLYIITEGDTEPPLYAWVNSEPTWVNRMTWIWDIPVRHLLSAPKLEVGKVYKFVWTERVYDHNHTVTTVMVTRI